MLKKNGTCESAVATQLEKIPTGTDYASISKAIFSCKFLYTYKNTQKCKLQMGFQKLFYHIVDWQTKVHFQTTISLTFKMHFKKSRKKESCCFLLQIKSFWALQVMNFFGIGRNSKVLSKISLNLYPDYAPFPTKRLSKWAPQASIIDFFKFQ